ncbi:PepSY domain-containing protein [Yoonia sp.]|uniref:PepSY domain-containing protein n=1 Tax=Yoonia sp. TaxID=2212373 RepID=UPI003F6BCC0D
MRTQIHAIAFLTCLLPGFAVAEIAEMSQAELRRAVAESGAISTRRLIAGVEDYTGGVVVDIRAFNVDGVVVYRIVVRQDDGQISTLMVDGNTGRAVSANSDSGKQITALSESSDGSPQLPDTANENASANASSNANAGRNANAGNNGRSNSNSGGSRGNSGGNSGGNKGGKDR